MCDIKKGLKIKKLKVDNYKVLKNFEIDFCDENESPLPIIVLAGVNGSGKTAILESIAYSFETKSILNCIQNGVEKTIITIKKISDNILYSGINDNRFLQKEKNDLEIVYIPYDLNNFYFINESIVKFIDKLIYEEDVKASEAYNQCAEFIKNTLEDIKLNIKFSKLDKDKKVYFNKNGNEFVLDKLSSGEKNLFAKLLYFYFEEIKDKVILIDEPELSLHPTWQAKVLKLYENYALKNNCQIILATHSPLILGSAKNEYIRILYFKDNKIETLKDDIFSYGRDIEWILQEVMGLEYTRNKNISQKINTIYHLIENNKLNEAEKEIDELEKIIGPYDKEILSLRNEIEFQRLDFEEDN